MPTRSHNRTAISQGAIGGVVGALVMATVAMLISAILGQGFFAPMKLIAGVLVVAPLQAGAFAIIVGVVIHLLVGAAFGALYGALTRDRLRGATAVGAGLLYGAVVFFVMVYLVLPWANPVMYAEWSTFSLFLYHLIYGATTAAYLAVIPTRVTADYRRY